MGHSSAGQGGRDMIGHKASRYNMQYAMQLSSTTLLSGQVEPGV